MKKSVLLISMCVLCSFINAQIFNSKQDRLNWWQDARFGMFIHWGPVSQTGKEIGWSRGSQTPIEVYDNLYKTFNPTDFNADEWVSVAKAAGMKYIVFTTKHHDGFCMWDTRQTDYNIMNSPFKRDVLKELSIACKKQGIALGTYYSTCDWHHPDFPLTSPGGKVRRPVSNIDAYTNYVKREVAELLLNYGPLSTIWFDVPQEFDNQRGQDLINFVQILQPDIIINNRTGAKGDYSTPEQRIGEMQMDRPWETCMTIGQQWSYKPNEKLKSLKECLQGLIMSASGNGNFLFNVGPSPMGIIEADQISILKQMGSWLNKNGESIYGTKGGPYIRTKSLASTRKDNEVFLHLLNINGSSITLPALSAQVLSATLLNGEKVDIKIADDKMMLKIPAQSRDSISTIVKLKLTVPAISLPLLDPMVDFNVTASNSKTKNTADLLINRNNNQNAVWRTDDSVRKAWVQIDLRRPRPIDGFVINEDAASKIAKFSLEYKKGDEWITLMKGSRVGHELNLKFKKITTQLIRLNILESDTPPALLALNVHEVE